MVCLEDIIYAAATMDCEGSIVISAWGNYSPNKPRRSPIFKVMVSVHNTNQKLIDWLLSTFGGNKHLARQRGNCKPVYGWTLNSGKAVEFITLIRPYLKLKTRQTEVAVALQRRIERTKKIGNRVGLSVDEVSERRLLKEEMGKLNRKGLEVAP